MFNHKSVTHNQASKYDEFEAVNQTMYNEIAPMQDMDESFALNRSVIDEAPAKK